MRNFAIRVVLGLAIVAGSIALARPASAMNRWRDFVKGPNNINIFMGVAGCCTCDPLVGCMIIPGTRIIAWDNDTSQGKNHNDQLWNQTTGKGVHTTVRDFMLTTGMVNACLGISGNATQKLANGTQLEVRTCDGGADQQWEIIPANDPSLKAPFMIDSINPCFIFRNVSSGKVMGISNGQVQNGTPIIQWSLFQGLPNSLFGWHPDQFWCPSSP
jgi:hypothetical protein